MVRSRTNMYCSYRHTHSCCERGSKTRPCVSSSTTASEPLFRAMTNRSVWLENRSKSSRRGSRNPQRSDLTKSPTRDRNASHAEFAPHVPHTWTPLLFGGSTCLVMIDFEPLDTWGEVTRVVEAEIGLTVHLRDQGGRSVKIDRLSDAHGVTTNAAGEEIWLFNLCADNRRRGFKGQRPHPRLFHELPGTDGIGPRAVGYLGLHVETSSERSALRRISAQRRSLGCDVLVVPGEVMPPGWLGAVRD